MILPEQASKLGIWARDRVDECRVSQGARAALARSLKQWLYSGSPDGNAAILNRLFPHIDRMASYLFSPRDLRFHMDFTHSYEKEVLDKAEVAGRVLTRQWRTRDIDLTYAKGVFLALTYGACIPKLMNVSGGLKLKLVMPWSFGVWREDKEDYDDQEAVCETSYITSSELWRRISHLSNAADLFKRARAYAKRHTSGEEADTYFHQVLIAGTPPVVQTDPPFSQQPGGLVSASADPVGAMIAPEVVDELITFHELWVMDDERGDWTTIQMAEPDILITSPYRRSNFFVPDCLPYGMIRPNEVSGNFWGRSEMADLMKLQNLLRDRTEDVKRLMSLQYDRIYFFQNFSGMTDEAYDQMRQAGYVTGEAGSDVKDITPELPKEWAADINEIMQFMDEVSGFQNIMSGHGEPGVRAATHAQTLLRTASPRMRDRALLIERQCADLGDKSFQVMAAKDARAYWTDNGSEFLLSQLPDDYDIGVDSHSSSPIYEEDHQQMAAFLAKLGVINGESLLDLLPVPMRDILKARYKEQQASKKTEFDQLKQQVPPEQLLKVIAGGKKK